MKNPSSCVYWLITLDSKIARKFIFLQLKKKNLICPGPSLYLHLHIQEVIYHLDFLNICQPITLYEESKSGKNRQVNFSGLNLNCLLLLQVTYNKTLTQSTDLVVSWCHSRCLLFKPKQLFALVFEKFLILIFECFGL